MRVTWAMLAAFLAVALFAAGCGGGSRSDTGYTEGEEGTGGGTASAGTGADPGAGTGTPSDENPNPEGWAKRITKGSGQESLGTEDMTEAEHQEMKAIGQDITKAHAIYQQYMEKKERDGTMDESLKNSALSMLDSVLDRLNKLLEKYPDSSALKEYHNTATSDHHALAWE
jgi:hypothetical protein